MRRYLYHKPNTNQYLAKSLFYRVPAEAMHALKLHTAEADMDSVVLVNFTAQKQPFGRLIA